MRPFSLLLIISIESSAVHVEGFLGHGSYGTVIRAKDVITDRVVAIKALHKVDNHGIRSLTEERAYMRLVGGCDMRIRSVGWDGSLITAVFMEH